MTVSKEEYRKTMTSVKVAFVLLTILFFAILVSFMVLLVQVRHVSHRAVQIAQDNATLLAENQQRIADDRKNKITQCKKVYSGVKDVFEIFFPKHANSRDKANIKKFNRRIDVLQTTCEKSLGN
jgi:hypothetical protein